MSDESWSDSPTIEECTLALINVQTFLHGEMPEEQADHIREHLMACEHCLDFYDSETLIAEMVRRCCHNSAQAPSSELRVRVTSLHVHAA